MHHPKARKHLTTILTKKVGAGVRRSGCSRSIANLKDVIHCSSKRHTEKIPSCSPRSIGSSEFLNPITHEVVLSNSSKCELKITGFNDGGAAASSAFVGTLMPGTPGPAGNPGMHYFNPSFRASHRVRMEGEKERGPGGVNGVFSNRRGHSDIMDSSGVSCHKCGEQFRRWEGLEAHHLSKHAVTELVEGDSSRKIVEIICRTNSLKSENHCGRIERVLKVHNMQKTLARFEDYRETVKIKASKLPKKHPRCIADGNELLRFYGTTIACSLGTNGSSSLCICEKCSVCQIIKNGFSSKKLLKGGIGVFTTSTSERAFENIEIIEDDHYKPSLRKALIVCRVIAGRVHRPLENIQEITGQLGFDSLAGKMGLYSNIEELYLLNPKALLPCFVVICKL